MVVAWGACRVHVVWSSFPATLLAMRRVCNGSDITVSVAVCLICVHLSLSCIIYSWNFLRGPRTSTSILVVVVTDATGWEWLDLAVQGDDRGGGGRVADAVPSFVQFGYKLYVNGMIREK